MKGTTIGLIKGDSRSLDYGSYQESEATISEMIQASTCGWLSKLRSLFGSLL